MQAIYKGYTAGNSIVSSMVALVIFQMTDVSVAELLAIVLYMGRLQWAVSELAIVQESINEMMVSLKKM